MSASQTYECGKCGVLVLVSMLAPATAGEHAAQQEMQHCPLCGSDDIKAPKPATLEERAAAIRKAAQKGYDGT